MQLRTGSLRATKFQENLKTLTTFFLIRILPMISPQLWKLVFPSTLFHKRILPQGKKIKTSKPSTNCSFKEQELRMWGLFFLKSSLLCRKNPNPVLILSGQRSSFGFCVS